MAAIDGSGADAAPVAHSRQEQARLAVSRQACALFWAHGVSGTSGDDIAAAAGLSTRTIWRYFRTKESCVEPVLGRSFRRLLDILNRWPAELSMAEHFVADAAAHPLNEEEKEDEFSALRIALLSTTEPALRSAYLMVHDQVERGLIPVVAKRLQLPEHDLTVRLCAAAVTAALRVVDEDVSRVVLVDKQKVTQAEVMELIDRAVSDATNGRFGGPMPR